MAVSSVGIEIKTSKKEKKEQTMQRVKTEFLRQVQEGVSEKEAFKNSLKAIDEKYNPKNDKYEGSQPETVGMSSESLNAIKKVMKDPIALGVWLDIIDKALPLIIKMGEATGKVVDWIIEHNAPKEETKNL